MYVHVTGTYTAVFTVFTAVLSLHSSLEILHTTEQLTSSLNIEAFHTSYSMENSARIISTMCAYFIFFEKCFTFLKIFFLTFLC